jgi:hypothetical protein
MRAQKCSAFVVPRKKRLRALAHYCTALDAANFNAVKGTLLNQGGGGESFYKLLCVYITTENKNPTWFQDLQTWFHFSSDTTELRLALATLPPAAGTTCIKTGISPEYAEVRLSKT